MKTNTKLVYTYTQENVIICGTSALKPNVEITLHQETLSLTKKSSTSFMPVERLIFL